ncbi:hypothetical protein SIN8267_01274 [Sinobacterium norvegicum]|uniref:RDD domain-containing protein n=2 Tax=Sinobacterium norvegicum TaxID=1641715 RepID=A0ABM9AD98_9GAMM|nr:hypothetical protein SIN8267_01274 [Sinobacterium norvegicum]
MVWDVLGLQPTSDKKLIKRTYAKKLKHTRPEDDAAAFQQLHTAYKQALKQAGYIASREQTTAEEAVATGSPLEVEDAVYDVDQAVDENIMADSPSDPIESVDDSQTAADRQVDEAELMEQAYDQIVAEVEQLLSTGNGRHLPDSWSFIGRSPYLFDQNFHWQLGCRIFYLIAEHNHQLSDRQKRYHLVEGAVLKYLDSLFDWRLAEESLRQRFPDQLVDDVLTLTPRTGETQSTVDQAVAGLRGGKAVHRKDRKDKASENIQFASDGKRLVALAIDIFAVIVVCKLAQWLLYLLFFAGEEAAFSATGVFTGLGFYLLSGWLFQCSSQQATPGQKLLGLRVVDRSLQRLPYLQGLWRTVAFALSGLGFKFIFVINFCLGGNYVHDRLSRSYVIVDG